MGDTLRLLQHDFLSSIPTIVFVILLLAILERLFFRPIAKTMEKRAERTVGALERAKEQVAAAEAKSRQYESALLAARQELYDRSQEERQKALAEREAALRTARERAEELVKNAQQALANEVSLARQQLSSSCQALAEEITETLLAESAVPTAGGGNRS